MIAQTAVLPIFQQFRKFSQLRKLLATSMIDEQYTPVCCSHHVDYQTYSNLHKLGQDRGEPMPFRIWERMGMERCWHARKDGALPFRRLCRATRITSGQLPLVIHYLEYAPISWTIILTLHLHTWRPPVHWRWISWQRRIFENNKNGNLVWTSHHHPLLVAFDSDDILDCFWKLRGG